MSEPQCHPRCDLGPKRDHPGSSAYRCLDASGTPLPWSGEDLELGIYDDPRLYSPEDAEPKLKWADLFGIDPDYTAGIPVDEWLDANRGEA